MVRHHCYRWMTLLLFAILEAHFLINSGRCISFQLSFPRSSTQQIANHINVFFNALKIYRNVYLSIILCVIVSAGDDDKEDVAVYEGDTIRFDCPAALTLLPGDGLEWFHNDVNIDPRVHGRRIRYSKRKNFVAIQYVAIADSGLWSVRANNSVIDRNKESIIWCNFTLTVDEFKEFETEAEQSDEHWTEKSVSSNYNIVENNTDHFQKPSGPSFKRFRMMESMKFLVKPTGTTVTFKCPAKGNKTE